ncbi:myrosinase 1-like isoform X2 [Aethina tumida]|nr:myrosinase 1-like isoform X2 [Aethina tumida]
MLKEINSQFYRISLSWTRILPNGGNDTINQDGIDYYNNLINELLANDIQPFVTIYHWDLPQVLQETGGWVKDELIDYFLQFARVAFENFGDRVKHWMTFNEINQICEAGYSEGSFAPNIVNKGIGGYECTHRVLLAHAKAYRMYDEEFRPTQNGSVGIAIDTYFHEPRDPNSESDKQAAEVALIMNYGWYANPIMLGNYPEYMIERIRNLSLIEGRNKSRLPEFTPEQVELVKGTYDFLGLNHYSSDLSYFAGPNDGDNPSHWRDVGVQGYQPDEWGQSASGWLRVYPDGLRGILIWIKENYGNPPVLITENGFSDLDGLEDDGRINYIQEYLYATLEAIHEHQCNVIGYTYWSLMDNFEWNTGYTQRFGLYHVNFTDPERTRTPKKSSLVYKNIIDTRHIDWDFEPSKK